MGLVLEKAVPDMNIARNEAAVQDIVAYAAATVVLMSPTLHLRRYLITVGIAACLVKALSLPIADSDSHPPWWSSWSRACQLKLFVLAVDHINGDNCGRC